MTLSLAALLSAAVAALGRNPPGVAAKPSNPRTTGATEQATPGFEQVQEWVSAVERHEMGRFDEHASRIASWPPEHLQAFLTDLVAVLRFLGRDNQTEFTHQGHRVSLARLQEILGLSDEETRTRDVGRVVKRGVLLHTDIVMRRGWHGDALWPWAALPRRAGSTTTRTVLLAVDGLQGASATAAVHLEFGRYLLDSVRPHPARDEMVRAWYRAVAAYLLGTRAWGDAEFHLDDARQLFPDDSWILYYNGALHEAYASPAVQAVRASMASSRSTSSVGTAGSELREARSFFRRAVAGDSSLLDARLRLARVMGQLGQHEEAAAELRQLLDQTPDQYLVYLGNLFLADEQQALGHVDAARECYERAADIYPHAQSPRLALSQLLRQAGDRQAALSVLGQILAARPSADLAADPWWEYSATAGRQVDAHFEEARRLCLEAEAR